MKKCLIGGIVLAAQLLVVANASAESVAGFSSGGYIYRNSDHHMNQIGILRETNGVRTYFSDKNFDDPYTVYVDYAWLPPSMVESTGVVTGTDDGGGVQRSVSHAEQAVISGFKVDYTSDDHHIKEFGVLTRTSDIQVYYGDENGDDDFTYQVDYTFLR